MNDRAAGSDVGNSNLGAGGKASATGPKSATGSSSPSRGTNGAANNAKDSANGATNGAVDQAYGTSNSLANHQTGNANAGGPNASASGQTRATLPNTGSANQ